MRTARLVPALGILLLGAQLTAIVHCGRQSARPPHVIVYMVDTLRAENVGAYGYERDTTPVIDALADQGVVFENAYAPASWTRPSVATLFTGVAPSRHGAKRLDQALRPDLATLAGVLRDHGYATHGFTCNPAIDPVFGFGQGFDTYAHYGTIDSNTRISEVHDPVGAFLDAYVRADSEEPLFLFIHSCAPHLAYAPPAPYDVLFTPRDETRTEARLALYDGEIAYSDAEFGKLVDRLRRSGLFEDSLFFLLSDHGEEFGEHGGWLHGHTLFEEVLRVPLILRLPGGEQAGRRVAKRVGLGDILPTVISLLDLPPVAGLDGLDLSGAIRGEPVVGLDRPMFFELDLRRNQVDALMVDDLKIVERRGPRPGAGLTLYAIDEGAPDRELEDSGRRDALKVMLDDIRSDLRGGLHVELSLPPEWETPHRIVGRVEILDGQIEALDAPRAPRLRFNVSEYATEVDFDVTLRNRPNVEPHLPPVGGRARMRLKVRGDTPRLRLTFDVDGASATRARMRVGNEQEARTVDVPFESSVLEPELDLTAPAAKGALPRTIVRFPGAGDLSEGLVDAHIYTIPERPENVVDLEPDMRARLRALGYVE